VGALSSCTTPGCPNLAERGRCQDCRRRARRDVDRRRPGARARGYDAAWERTRARVLANQPRCQRCRREPAVEVHHRDGRGPLGPRGHVPETLAALCDGCHARHTARAQPGGWNR
jgi:5-methylcytosine-specific restriction protein A